MNENERVTASVAQINILMDFVKSHFYQQHGFDSTTHRRPIQEFVIDRNLNYHIVCSVQRMYETFGEVSRRDVIVLAEVWMMTRRSESGHGPGPLQHIRQPVEQPQESTQ